MQRALWYLAATTGMRRGEVCGLRWEDVDLDAGELAVKSSHVMVGGKVVESAPKTKRGRRVIALDPATIDVLRAWRRQQRRERLRYGLAWEDEGDHLLTHAVYFTKPPRHGVPVRPDWVTMAFRRLVDGSGLPDLNLHGLRHSWATAAYDAGEPLRAVSDHLGHADTSITDRIYIHAVRRVQDATALRVAALITSKRGAGR
jgi:integrase